MSSITARLEKFIANHELDRDVADLDTLVKRCIGDLYENVKDVAVNIPKEKQEKLEEPAKAQHRDDLRNCTKEVLNSFCKENGLRVGGTKKEVMDRVWRFTQDESSDEDISPRSEKKKKEKKVVEKHECCGKTAKGSVCQVIAEDEKIGGKFYCWRHAKSALADLKKSADSESESDEE